VVEGTGKIVSEAKVASEPQALIAWFASLGLKLTRIGLEAGPLTGLTRDSDRRTPRGNALEET
jgi:hypothetical protein